jgi:hypothetical protein
MENEKSHSHCFSNFTFWSSLRTEYTSCLVSSARSGAIFSGTRLPSMRNCGGVPRVMWRSDAPRSIMARSSWSKVTCSGPW